jgi:hypothetical protein
MNMINFLSGGAASGLGALVPLYAIDRYGLSVLASGTLLTARGVAVIVLASVAAFALRRTGYRRPMFVGFILTTAGMFALAVSPLGLSPYAWLAAAAGLTGIGVGWSGPATRNACLQLAPEQSASIAALRSMGRQPVRSPRHPSLPPSSRKATILAWLWQASSPCSRSCCSPYLRSLPGYPNTAELGETIRQRRRALRLRRVARRTS